ncbi:MAG: type II toxin-antitoxin system PemK/MazF family toxin [Betaproteobacteria bacterium]|nr:type II toxin-antitoxin system PemK/MazF family toxin [Betaproteobacteria bacterium]MBI2961677.1 type II toxin-antitoxin system PemK/MazF family toxin [Betaproteobacteria bacterium]
MARVAQRGDIYHIDLDPTKGREQRGRRFIFVVSPGEHNRRGLVIALPISQGQTLARSTGYACTLMGAGTRTQGVIICDQPRTLDLSARGARYVETVPHNVTDDVLSRIAPLVT